MQHYQNHRRFSPLYHFITLPSILALIIGSFINLANSTEETLYPSSLICLAALLLLLVAFFARRFALTAQDRAIRAEENLRHYLLTTRAFDARLSMGQIIALRFASDAELAALAQKAADDKMLPNDIKKAIKNWRADNHRV